MHPSTYETQAVIRLHQQDLLQAAERERMLLAQRRMVASPLHRALAGIGEWLVRMGTQLVRRYADAPAGGSLAIAQQSEP